MLKLLALGNGHPRPGQPLPAVLAPLVDAAQRGDDLRPRVAATVASFGFDSLECLSTSAARDPTATDYAFTTIPEWTRHYHEAGYRGSDPRVFVTTRSAIPLVWDQSSVRGYGAGVKAFAADARAHGVASGVSLSWHAPEGVEVMVALNSRARYHDDVRYHAITRNLAEILAFAHYFHDTFVLPAISAHQAREIELPPLSRREAQCLSLAAQGMTTKGISAALHVSARTVQAEFERICGKYGAANRREAIALAVRTGAVRAPAKGVGGRVVA